MRPVRDGRRNGHRRGSGELRPGQPWSSSASLGRSGCVLIHPAVRHRPAAPRRLGRDHPAGSVSFQGTSLVGMTDKQLAVLRWERHVGGHAERDERAQPSQVDRRAVQGRDAGARRPVPRRRSSSRSAEVLRMVGIDPEHLEEPIRTSSPAACKPAVRDRDGPAVYPDLGDHGRADLGAGRRGPAVADGPGQGTSRSSSASWSSSSPMTCRWSAISRMHSGGHVRGQVAELGATRQVFDAPLHPYSAGLLDAFPSDPGAQGPAHRNPRPPAGPGQAPGRLAGSCAALPEGRWRPARPSGRLTSIRWTACSSGASCTPGRPAIPGAASDDSRPTAGLPLLRTKTA